MENAELEVALEELENRLERLRALYEQYFMGIERIEPAIPRKDIDRRIYVLRREKIRNTAKRFKLQTIISRYNTFQQYWQRICREIENGTYKRHVIRAERIAPGQLLTIAARKRLGRAALEAMAPESAPPGGADASSAASAPASDLPAAPVTAAPATPGSAAPGGLSRLAPPTKPVPPPKPGTRPAPPPNVPTGVPVARTTAPSPPPTRPAPPPPPRRAFESLTLDMDFLGDWDPNTARAKGPPGKRVPEVPARPFGKPLAQPMGVPAAPGVGAPPPLVVPRKPPPVAPPSPRVPPASPSKPVSLPPRPPGLPISKPLAARPAPPPAAAKALAPLIPGAVTPRPTAPSAGSGSMSDDRVRELHARLVEARRQTQDSAAVSVEGLAKSMRATEAKLREEHKNRKIDFDVVIKDGKAVLKPIVR